MRPDPDHSVPLGQNAMTGGPSLMQVVEREPKKAAEMLHSLAPEVRLHQPSQIPLMWRQWQPSCALQERMDA